MPADWSPMAKSIGAAAGAVVEDDVVFAVNVAVEEQLCLSQYPNWHSCRY